MKAVIFLHCGEWTVREPNGCLEPEGTLEACIAHCRAAGWGFTIEI